jgi:hypothetical protein
LAWTRQQKLAGGNDERKNAIAALGDEFALPAGGIGAY